MANEKTPALSRRERQIMDVLYKLERASAAEIQTGLPEQPNYSTVRAQLRVLEDKGHVGHDEQNLRYIYFPMMPREKARSSALRHLADTFFNGSTEQVVAALLGGEAAHLKPEELDRLSLLVEEAKAKAATAGKPGKPDHEELP